MRTLKEIYGIDRDPTDSDYIEWILKFKYDFKLFSERVLELEIMPFHMEWFNIISKHDKVNIIAPTGHGKTMLIGVAYILWRCFYDKDKSFMIVANAEPQAVKTLTDIKSRLENNEFLRYLIPQKIIKWTETEIRLGSNCVVYSKPFTENLRSYHVHYLLSDETSSFMDHSLFFSYLVTRVESLRGKVVSISTPKCITDLTQVLLHKKTWFSKVYPSIQQDGSTLWPTRFSRERLAEIRDDIGQVAFDREYLCKPSEMAENAVFPSDLVEKSFDYTRGFTASREFDDSTVIIGVDLAIASGPRADYDAYVVVEKSGSKIAILYGETHRGLSIFAKVNRLVELASIYKANALVIDVSNIGIAVCEKLREKGITVIGKSFDAKSRGSMIIKLRELFDKDYIVIPRKDTDEAAMRFTTTLVNELISFSETRTKLGTVSYQSTTSHDDTAVGTCLACCQMLEKKDYVDCIAI